MRSPAVRRVAVCSVGVELRPAPLPNPLFSAVADAVTPQLSLTGATSGEHLWDCGRCAHECRSTGSRAAVWRVEVAAGNRISGRLAYTLWLIGTCCGWQQARIQLPRATFFRQLAIIRKAGLDAPDLRAEASLNPAHAPAVDASPFSQVMQLPGQRFEVTQRIDDDWHQGEICIVHSVLFRELQWFVQITGEPNSTLQGSYTDVELRAFLASTKLLSEHVSQHMSAI